MCRKSARAGAAVTRDYFNASNRQEYGPSLAIRICRSVLDAAVLMWQFRSGRIQNNGAKQREESWGKAEEAFGRAG